jgi:hypothetical protein
MKELCNDIFRSFYQIKVIMEKKGILTRILVLLALLLAMAGCSDEIDLGPLQPPVPLIGEAGGTVTGFNGDVVLTIPPGAVSEPTRFFISITDGQKLLAPDGHTPGKSANVAGDVIKTFVIEPFVRFKTPAELTVNCRGCLSTGFELCSDMEVSFYVWDSQKGYINQSETCVYCCCMDSGCLTACISSTGVISARAERH